jgi:large subunit ribosomal protein L10
MADAAQWKLDRVQEIKDAITNHRVVGIVGIHGIPAKQMSKMRTTLRGNVEVMVTKRTILKRALDQSAETVPGIEDLKDEVEGQVGLVLTEENPFRLFRLMEATKTRTPAKGGEIATENIVVKVGDTKYKPGPIVREFQNVGIPAAIERGKVVIKKSATLVKTGEVIPKALATVLPRLDILPLMVGLDLKAAFEDGITYRPDVLDVDIDAMMGRFAQGAQAAFNLAMDIGYPTPATVRPMLALAHGRALSLAMEAGVVTPETVQILLAKGQSHALSLATLVPEAPVEEAEKEEPPAEEKEADEKEEPPAKKEEPPAKKEEPSAKKEEPPAEGDEKEGEKGASEEEAAK